MIRTGSEVPTAEKIWEAQTTRLMGEETKAQNRGGAYGRSHSIIQAVQKNEVTLPESSAQLHPIDVAGIWARASLGLEKKGKREARLSLRLPRHTKSLLCWSKPRPPMAVPVPDCPLHLPHCFTHTLLYPTQMSSCLPQSTHMLLSESLTLCFWAFLTTPIRPCWLVS